MLFQDKSMSFAFRQATPADAERLDALYAEACTFLCMKAGAAKTSPQWDAEWFDKASFESWTAQGRVHLWETAQSAVAGAVFLESEDQGAWPEAQWRDDKALYVHKLYVGRIHAGVGLGANFLQQIEGYAAGIGKTELRLDCLDRPPLVAFYEGNGFGRVDTMHYFDRPAVRWRKPLALQKL